MATTTGPGSGRPLELELTRLDEGAEKVELEVPARDGPAAPPRRAAATPAPEPRFSPLAFTVAVLLGLGWLATGGSGRRAVALLLLVGAALALRRAGGPRGAAVTWGLLDLLLAAPLALALHLGADAATATWQRLRPRPTVTPREQAVERLRARLLAEGEAERVTALEPTVPRGATLNVDGETLLLEASRCDQALVDGVAARWADELRDAGLRYLRCEARGRLYESPVR